MSDKITEYIKREMSGGKKDFTKVLGVYPEHILCAIEDDYLGYSGLYVYLDDILENYKPSYVVISTHMEDVLEDRLMSYFAENGISVRTSSEYSEKNKISVIICCDDIDRKDVMFRIDVPMEIYRNMGRKICSDCYEKIAGEYPAAAKQFRKIGFFSSEKCPICGR